MARARRGVNEKSSAILGLAGAVSAISGIADVICGSYSLIHAEQGSCARTFSAPDGVTAESEMREQALRTAE